MYSTFLRVAVWLSIVLMGAGCGLKKDSEPLRLVDDQAFLVDLARARNRGPAGIVLVAPASGTSEEGERRICATAERLGVVMPEGVFQSGLVPYNANSDEARLRLLADAFNDPALDIVWAVRGGYGASRLLRGLSERIQTSDPKIFIGYSDMTFIHLFLSRLGWPTIHGSMFEELHSVSKDVENFRLLAALLAGTQTTLRYEGLHPYNTAALQLSQPVESSLIGGNLTCLAAAIGTPWQLDAAGKLLFLEDVKEPGYKIDRMLTQMVDSGMFDAVEAIILGSFSSGDAFTEFALERFAASFDKPVFKTDLFGHGPKNYPLVFTVPARLAKDASAMGFATLTLDAGSLFKTTPQTSGSIPLSKIESPVVLESDMNR